ncbi:MAG TPA: peptidylprolyl isomerase [Candidatus Limnocylindrales bacterium]|jgi:peptidyl-prolyl cis-trans isomerase B (cyclophilin B)|nr:peptidylprolyl isomerase [Candidatus Limnocylindrales bacterium]
MIRHATHRSRLVAAAIAIPALIAACSSGGGAATVGPATIGPSEAGGGPTDCPTTQPAPLGSDEKRLVTISTSEGDIQIEVDGALSPIAAGNFVALAECGWYDGVIFHRVIPGFVIQGGDGQFGRSPNVDPNQVGTGGPPYTIEDEPVTAKYGRGTVAMARTNAPNSVGSQFFIVTDDAAEGALSSYNTYQIVGNVTSGMDVVDTIVNAPRNQNDLPDEPVVMNTVTVSTP